MTLVLLFAVLLFIAVLLSCKARESVLSASSLFLIAGLFLGKFWPSSITGVHEDALYQFAQIALFATLFSDGMRSGGLAGLRRESGITARVLFLGMAFTIAVIALLAHFMLGYPWTKALLIGAVLSPTDPVFVAAIFQFEAVPQRVRHVLNIESGFNDGLALPIVLLLLNNGHDTALHIAFSLVAGVALGIAIPWLAIRIEQTRFFGAAGLFQRLNAFAIGVLLYAVAEMAHANAFLAAFSGGITVAAVGPAVRDAFNDFGEVITELLKLVTLLIFGALVAHVIFVRRHWAEYLFVVLAVFAARLIAVPLALIGRGLPRSEVLALGYFGPKGFASVVYALMLLRIGGQSELHPAALVGLAVVLSILVYSSTDVLVGQRFQSAQKSAA